MDCHQVIRSLPHPRDRAASANSASGSFPERIVGNEGRKAAREEGHTRKKAGLAKIGEVGVRNTPAN
jgi:hypothetical protein